MDTYTDPKLRERLKHKIIQGDQGGRPGQWSAVKAMMLAKQYKDAMISKGKKPYRSRSHSRSRSRSPSSSLKRWMGEKWRTYDKKPAIRGEKTTYRFLPDKVWGMLSKKEIERTNERKKRSRHQFISNPDSVKEKAACFRHSHSLKKCSRSRSRSRSR